MIDEALKEIIANFGEQYNLYKEMLLTIERLRQRLEGETGAKADLEEIARVLKSRQELMQSISSINLRNQELQRQTLREYNLDDFVLSQLKTVLAEDTFTELSAVVHNLGDILQLISETDEKIQNLMKQELIQGPRNNPKPSSQQAGAAYRQAMNQGKPKS